VRPLVIVTGGRDFQDERLVFLVLEYLNPEKVIQGGAAGADALARAWAAKLGGVPCETFEADWATHGKAAGPIRNREMLFRYPYAVVVAFPGGRGTEDCVKQARERNHIVLRVEPPAIKGAV
jgi:hypothetical protein